MSIKWLGFSSYLAVLLCLPITSSAVADIVLKPEIPGPYEKVVANISGYVIDIDRAEVYWYQNEEIKKQGIGERSFEFTVGGIGSETVINVVIVTFEGQRIDKQLIIRPIEVDLLWEADSYTPPFYRGKAHPTSKSSLNVVAIPNTPNLAETNFLYTWKEGFFNIAKNYSGYERNFYKLESQLAPYRRSVDVEAVSLDKSLRAKNQVFIESVEPELVPYQNLPLSGVNYSKRLTSPTELSSDELVVTIEPFFFDTGAVLKNELRYQWTANGNFLRESTSAGSNTYIFSRPDLGGASVLVGIGVINNLEWLQRGETELGLYVE